MNRSWPTAPVWMIVIQLSFLQFMGARGYVFCTNDYGRTALELCTTTCECRQIIHHTCPIAHGPAFISCHHALSCQDIPILDKIQSLNPSYSLQKSIDIQPIVINTVSPYFQLESLLPRKGSDPPDQSLENAIQRLSSIVLII